MWYDDGTDYIHYSEYEKGYNAGYIDGWQKERKEVKTTLLAFIHDYRDDPSFVVEQIEMYLNQRTL